MRYALAVLTGDWQLPHLDDGLSLQYAHEHAQRVLIVITPAYLAPSPRQAFTATERQAMLLGMLTTAQQARTDFLFIRDYAHPTRWLAALQQGLVRLNAPTESVLLLGSEHQAAPAYLQLLPSWHYVALPLQGQQQRQKLREILFGSPAPLALLAQHLHPEVHALLQKWLQQPLFSLLQAEFEATLRYQENYPAAYALTADSLVHINEHILLIQRGGNIGKGLWALPGGFMEADETFYQTAVRELQEETGLGLADTVLWQAYQGQACFDAPQRSARARIITQACYFRLELPALPPVLGADDARQAQWWPVSALPQLESQLFEDHALLIDHFIPFLA